MKNAWIAGATGLVGSHLLVHLLAASDFGSVVSFGRRPAGAVSPKLTERQTDFATLDTTGLPAPDVAFCTLGTTIARAGSQAAFRAVDHDAVLAFARAALAAGAQTFVVVSSLGADAKSRMFYARVKGEMEADLQALGFASLGIAQPSLLLGDRAESRPGERLAVVASRLLGGLLKPFAARPIEATVVAQALVAIGRAAQPGVAIYPSVRLHSLGV
jgi:uncharacterized protein YbjT (DUF2867 family)